MNRSIDFVVALLAILKPAAPLRHSIEISTERLRSWRRTPS
jgi:hypothetical protein